MGVGVVGACCLWESCAADVCCGAGLVVGLGVGLGVGEGAGEGVGEGVLRGACVASALPACNHSRLRAQVGARRLRRDNGRQGIRVSRLVQTPGRAHFRETAARWLLPDDSVDILPSDSPPWTGGKPSTLPTNLIDRFHGDVGTTHNCPDDTAHASHRCCACQELCFHLGGAVEVCRLVIGVDVLNHGHTCHISHNAICGKQDRCRALVYQLLYIAVHAANVQHSAPQASKPSPA